MCMNDGSSSPIHFTGSQALFSLTDICHKNGNLPIIIELMNHSTRFDFMHSGHITYVFHLLSTVGCLSYTVQNDVCAEFDTGRLFSHSSAL